MSADLLLALVAFAFVTSVTPGPNNVMLLASGANFGLRRTVPHMLGISLGHAAMVALVGLGLAAAFEAEPRLRLALAAVSVAYLVWLAWRIAMAAPPGEGTGRGRPMTFGEAAAFQWVNPKAWTMALGAVTLYAAGTTSSVLIVAAVFALVNLPSVSLWAALGVQIRRLLGTPGRLRPFNRTMAALLLASLWPTVAPLL
jgi:threonine/homoserine/homoserine lactone efflux protein